MRPDQSKLAARAGWISILVNVLLFGFKYWAGIASGSVAIIADAWHTLSDSITSIIVVISVWIASRPADEEHPFGHGRAEILATTIIGVLLTVIAVEFFIESVQRLTQREEANYGTLAIVITAISVLAKEGLARYSIIAGKKTGSRSLKADAWHHRSDAISSVVILAGIFLNKYIWWIDGAMGILVTLLILHAAYGILKDVFHAFLGEKPDKQIVDKINDICTKHYGSAVYPHHIHVHHYGSHTEMTLHIKLDKKLSLEGAHNITSMIEDDIRTELGIEATIHTEPRIGRVYKLSQETDQ
jgi:cation diffusion facilitator family transporter